MRMPEWSYDALAGQYASYDAAEAAYSTFTALATHGAV
jgi:hypothetical protein